LNIWRYPPCPLLLLLLLILYLLCSCPLLHLYPPIYRLLQCSLFTRLHILIAIVVLIWQSTLLRHLLTQLPLLQRLLLLLLLIVERVRALLQHILLLLLLLHFVTLRVEVDLRLLLLLGGSCRGYLLLAGLREELGFHGPGRREEGGRGGLGGLGRGGEGSKLMEGLRGVLRVGLEGQGMGGKGLG